MMVVERNVGTRDQWKRSSHCFASRGIGCGPFDAGRLALCSGLPLNCSMEVRQICPPGAGLSSTRAMRGIFPLSLPCEAAQAAAIPAGPAPMIRMSKDSERIAGADLHGVLGGELAGTRV